MFKTKISRRNFLGSVFLLASVPTSVLAASEEKEESVLRYAVISDVHFSSNPNSNERNRLQKALAYLGKSKFDALVIAGDVTNHGYTSELELFRNTLYEGLPEGTQALICMGNHEFIGKNDHARAGGAHQHWENIFQKPVNTHTVIKGFHFIGVSPDRGNGRAGDFGSSMNWLSEQLKEAAKDNPKRPIVVFQHYHVSETVYGSCGIDHWGIPDLKPLLDEYPQVINYSGHSHYPSNDLRSVWQGNFTAFGTSTLSYYEMTGGIFEKFPSGHRNAAQMYIVDVKKDFSMYLKIYDVLTDSFFPTSYIVAEPGNISKYIYTNQRFETSSAPKWEGASEVKISDIQPSSVVLTFPQAYDASQPESFIGSYQITVTREKTSPEGKKPEKEEVQPSETTTGTIDSPENDNVDNNTAADSPNENVVISGTNTNPAASDNIPPNSIMSNASESAPAVSNTAPEGSSVNSDNIPPNSIMSNASEPAPAVSNATPEGSPVVSDGIPPHSNMSSSSDFVFTPIDAAYEQVRNPWSQYYFKNQPKEMSYCFNNLLPGLKWTVEVRARNVFGKLSEKALVGTFQTPEE